MNPTRIALLAAALALAPLAFAGKTEAPADKADCPAGAECPDGTECKDKDQAACADDDAATTQPASAEAGETSTPEEAPAVLNFEMKNIDGQPVQLARKYKGKVVLMVNVASKCGLTPQYKELEALHEKYAGKGLSVVGFPANNFGSQEPGSEEEIKEFCTTNYGVKFDMFSKISVKGDDQHPLYRELTSKETARFPGDINWNFEKFLIGRDGEVLARFSPQTKPSDEAVVKAIEEALAKGS